MSNEAMLELVALRSFLTSTKDAPTPEEILRRINERIRIREAEYPTEDDFYYYGGT